MIPQHMGIQPPERQKQQQRKQRINQDLPGRRRGPPITHRHQSPPFRIMKRPPPAEGEGRQTVEKALQTTNLFRRRACTAGGTPLERSGGEEAWRASGAALRLRRSSWGNGQSKALAAATHGSSMQRVGFVDTLRESGYFPYYIRFSVKLQNAKCTDREK